MKALSIMQPWAWLIVNGHKDIENRQWQPTNPGLRFSGKVLIHAALSSLHCDSTHHLNERPSHDATMP